MKNTKEILARGDARLEELKKQLSNLPITQDREKQLDKELAIRSEIYDIVMHDGVLREDRPHDWLTALTEQNNAAE